MAWNREPHVFNSKPTGLHRPYELVLAPTRYVRNRDHPQLHISTRNSILLHSDSILNSSNGYRVLDASCRSTHSWACARCTNAPCKGRRAMSISTGTSMHLLRRCRIVPRVVGRRFQQALLSSANTPCVLRCSPYVGCLQRR